MRLELAQVVHPKRRLGPAVRQNDRVQTVDAQLENKIANKIKIKINDYSDNPRANLLVEAQRAGAERLAAVEERLELVSTARKRQQQRRVVADIF